MALKWAIFKYFKIMKFKNRLILIRLNNKLRYEITNYKPIKIHIIKWIHK